MSVNLKQQRKPLGTCCGIFFFNSSKQHTRYSFPLCIQLFESRTIEAGGLDAGEIRSNGVIAQVEGREEQGSSSIAITLRHIIAF